MMLVMLAVPRALFQPSQSKIGTINTSDTNTPTQPERMVWTMKVIRPPATVPRMRAEAALIV